jgi:hypothetical protein
MSMNEIAILMDEFQGVAYSLILSIHEFVILMDEFQGMACTFDE